MYWYLAPDSIRPCYYDCAVLRIGFAAFLLARLASAQSTGSAVGQFVHDFGDSTIWMAEAPFQMGGRNFAIKFVPIAAATTALTYGDPAAARYASTRPELNAPCTLR